MESNSLGQNETQEAANEGAGIFADLLSSKIGAGKLDQVKDLFQNREGFQNNELFQNLQGKLGQILQNKGMNAQEAEAEAQNVAPGIIDSLRERFESKEEADSGFDLNNIQGMIGNAGDAVNKIKGFFGK